MQSVGGGHGGGGEKGRKEKRKKENFIAISVKKTHL